MCLQNVLPENVFLCKKRSIYKKKKTHTKLIAMSDKYIRITNYSYNKYP